MFYPVLDTIVGYMMFEVLSFLFQIVIYCCWCTLGFYCALSPTNLDQGRRLFLNFFFWWRTPNLPANEVSFQVVSPTSKYNLAGTNVKASHGLWASIKPARLIIKLLSVSVMNIDSCPHLRCGWSPNLMELDLESHWEVLDFYVEGVGTLWEVRKGGKWTDRWEGQRGNEAKGERWGAAPANRKSNGEN